MTTGFTRVVAAVEKAAAAFLMAVTLLSFAAVVARYVFNTGIPDAFDGARYLLGAVIFWGLASACHRGDHITMDLVWSLSGARVRRALDVFAGAVVTAGLAFLLWQFSEKVVESWHSGHGTIDLSIPVALFYALAWIGLAAAQIFALARLIRLALGREAADAGPDTQPVE